MDKFIENALSHPFITNSFSVSEKIYSDIGENGPLKYVQSFFQKDELTTWEHIYSSCVDTLEAMVPYAVTLYWYIFFFLIVTATVGRKLMLRRFYIQVLDKIFYKAAIKMEEKTTKEKMRRRSSYIEEYEVDSDEEIDTEKCESKLKTSTRDLRKTQKDDQNLQITIQNSAENSSETSRESGSLESSWEDLRVFPKKISSKETFNVAQFAAEFINDERSIKDHLQNRKSNVKHFDDITDVFYQKPTVEKLNVETSNVLELNTDKMTSVKSAQNADSLVQLLEDDGPSDKEPPVTSGVECTGQTEGFADCRSDGTEIRKFPLDAPMTYASAGMRAILDDCVNNSFSPEQLKTWNFLSRTIQHQKAIRQSKSLAGFFLVSLIFRYFFLMPMRVLVLSLSLGNLAFCTFIVGCLPDGAFKRTINSYVVSWGFDFVAGSISVFARFHNKENRPDHGIAVANHTSPIDGMVLATDNCYDMVGQKTKGLLGMFMNSLSKSSGHIWFERSDARDRQATTRLLTEHTRNRQLPPILIFPEGVCVNNTAVLEFRKGAFEVDCDIFPIAVRFDPVYGDAFWSTGGFAAYCFSMMTSWAIVCDVFYLPPVRKQPEESSIEFASRVRSSIARAGGLAELHWSSLVKSCTQNHDKWAKLREERQQQQQQLFVRKLSLDEDSQSGDEKHITS